MTTNTVPLDIASKQGPRSLSLLTSWLWGLVAHSLSSARRYATNSGSTIPRMPSTASPSIVHLHGLDRSDRVQSYGELLNPMRHQPKNANSQRSLVDGLVLGLQNERRHISGPCFLRKRWMVANPKIAFEAQRVFNWGVVGAHVSSFSSPDCPQRQLPRQCRKSTPEKRKPST